MVGALYKTRTDQWRCTEVVGLAVQLLRGAAASLPHDGAHRVHAGATRPALPRENSE